MNAEERMKEYKPGGDSRPVNMVTEYLGKPLQWDLDNPKYTWLDESTKRYLRTKFGFDWSWILYAEANYLNAAQIAEYCMTTQDEIDKYCMALWRKPWVVLHAALSRDAKNLAVGQIFKPWAEEGNSAAISVMKSIVGVGNDENQDGRQITVKVVNDIG